VPAVQNAVNAGGIVILQGVFDFGANGYIDINNEVTISGEPGTVIKNGGQADPTKGVFNAVAQVPFDVSGLRFENPMYCAVFVMACNGAVISNNVILHPQPNLVKTARGISINDFEPGAGVITGDITIEKNEIEYDPSSVGSIDFPWAIVVSQPGVGGNYTIKENIIKNPGLGIGVSQEGVTVSISYNTIIGLMERGIWIIRSDVAVEKNAIRGQMLRAIQLNNVEGAVIIDNTIYRVKSPAEHQWWNGAIALDYCETCQISNNTISGVGNSAIHLCYTNNCLFKDNDIAMEIDTFSGFYIFGDSGHNEFQGNKLMGVVGYPFYLDYDHLDGKKYEAAHDNTIHGNNIVKITALEYPNPNYQPFCTPANPGAEFTEPEMDLAPGKPGFGQALDFTGTDLVYLGRPSQLNFGTNDFTMSAWINTTSASSPQSIFTNGAGWSGGIRADLSVRNGYASLDVDDDNVKYEMAGGTTIVNYGVWHHVVGVRRKNIPTVDDDTLELYVDGNLEVSQVISTNYNIDIPSTQSAQIGALLHNVDRDYREFFTGLIDEVVVWNRALNSTEIGALHSGGIVPPSDLVVYYNCDSFSIQNDYQIVPDVSGNGIDGYVNPQKCPIEYEPPYLAGANIYLGQGAVINNDVRGYSGGSVIDEADYFTPIMVWFISYEGQLIYQFRDYMNTYGNAGYKDGNLAEPYYYHQDDLAGPYVAYYNDGTGWNFTDQLYLPRTEPMDGLIPYQGGDVVLRLKNNYVTGFEPMTGAGEINQQVSSMEAATRYPTVEEIQAFKEWLAQNPQLQ